jgi:PIN domain nuclease of toxin-antitoxin system
MQVGVSAVTLLEIPLLGEGRQRLSAGVNDLLDQVDANPIFRIIPFTTDIAREVAALGDSLRDPVDRAIVATARIHRLTLLTSDQRIIDSNLVAIVE